MMETHENFLSIMLAAAQTMGGNESIHKKNRLSLNITQQQA
jgi:hypothetical protein